ncbi:hypothetical protein HPB49_026215 [Dermacentor silvarum]|nr:hypothetical protein HPB49_026215 [Dermacentor silvarum]
MGVSGDLDYLLIYDPSEQVKIQPPVDQEAPPLPVKGVVRIQVQASSKLQFGTRTAQECRSAGEQQEE